MIKLKQEGWQCLSIGIMGHSFSTFGFFEYDWSYGPAQENFFIANGFGLGLDVLAFTKFAKARKIKKQLEATKPKY